MNAHEFKEYFERLWLDFVSSKYSGDHTLHQACKYALEGCGKRVRPTLMYLVANSLNSKNNLSHLMITGFAIEMIHTYSLVHDDLPEFDDDLLRRGRASVHAAYDPATAILVGDAILSDSWGLLTKDIHSGLSHKELLKRFAIIESMSEACGSEGMVLGQYLDTYWTQKTSGYSYQDLERLHSRKTGDLIASACISGAIIAGADDIHLKQAKEFGLKIGLVFQIIDDLLDNTPATGKSSGKDEIQGKLTFLKFMKKSEARDLADQLTQESLQIIHSWQPSSSHPELKNYILTLLDRTT